MSHETTSKKPSQNEARPFEIHQSQLWMDFPARFPSQIIILGHKTTQGSMNPFGKGRLHAAFLPPHVEGAAPILQHAGRKSLEQLWTGCCAERGALSNQTSWRARCLEIKSDCLFSNASRGAWGGRCQAGAGWRKQLELVAPGFPSSSTVSWDLPLTCGRTALDGDACRAFPLSG